MSTWPAISHRILPLEIRKGVELREQYVFGDFLGSGGFGTVWKATDKKGSRDVAIKRLTAQSPANPEDVLAEAESTRKLTGHKNIVQLYDTFVENGEAFLVMEYVDGGSLQDLLKKHVVAGSWIDQEEALDYVKQILEALIYAHSSGIYHRDITPSNILVSGLGVVKLADFGLAKAMTEVTRSHGKGEFAWSGTIHYMSVEQARGESLNHLTDIMSVGIVAYILLTGKHPFNHPSGILTVADLIKDINYSCPIPTALNGKALNATLSEMLRKLLCKDKAARYQSLVEPLGLLTRDDSIQCQQCLHSNPKSNRFCGQCGKTFIEDETSKHPAHSTTQLNAEQLTARGFARTKVNDWEGAIFDYREALKVDPQHSPANANLGFALNRRGNFEEAVIVATAGLGAAKDDGVRHRLYDVIGFAKYSLNEPQDAIKSYTSALELRDNPRSLVNRAEAYAAVGDIPAAWEDVLSALDIDEEYQPATRLHRRLEKLI